MGLASENNYWNPLVHSRSRDRGNPGSNSIARGSRRGNQACSRGRGLVLTCGKSQRQVPQAVPPTGALPRRVSAAKSPRPTPRPSFNSREANHSQGSFFDLDSANRHGTGEGDERKMRVRGQCRHPYPADVSRGGSASTKHAIQIRTNQNNKKERRRKKEEQKCRWRRKKN